MILTRKRRLLLGGSTLSALLLLVLFHGQTPPFYYSSLGWLHGRTVYLPDWSGLEAADRLPDDSPFAVVTSGCRIPRTDGPEDGVAALVRRVNLAGLRDKCETRQPQPHLTRVNDHNQVVVDELELRKLNVMANSSETFYCQATPIARDMNGGDGDRYHYEEDKSVRFRSTYNVTTNFVRVRCYRHSVLVYTDFHGVVQPHTASQEARYHRLFERQVDRQARRQYWPNDDRDTPSPDDDRLSVLVLTLDSVSRANFDRQMPLTRQLLLHTMGGVELPGYGKTGDNTLPILLNLLTGRTKDELTWRCPLSYDGCPFVWKSFAEAGYRTVFGEDSAIIHTFNMESRGFGAQPTDDYLRPLYLAEYESAPRTPWNQQDYNCFSNRPQFQVILDWLRQLLRDVRHRPLFAYLHTSSVTHDELNWVQWLDKPLHELLSQAMAGGWLRRTALFIISDHGMRFGGVRDTPGGRLEENLPLLTVTLPEWWRQRHATDAMAALRSNANRLITPFDIHRTLLHLLGAQFDTGTNITRPEYRDGYADDSRGYSLFRPIPAERDCVSAAIPAHFCPCRSTSAVDVADARAIRAADAVVAHVNAVTVSQRHLCTKLKRRGSVRHCHRLYDAAAAQPARRNTNQKEKMTAEASNVTDYLVSVETTPGGAWLEGTVRLLANGSVLEVLDVSRTNSYGNQAACLHNLPELRKFCYCDNRRRTAPAPSAAPETTAATRTFDTAAVRTSDAIEAAFARIVHQDGNFTKYAKTGKH